MPMIKRYLAITLVLPTIVAIFIYSFGGGNLALPEYKIPFHVGLILLSFLVSIATFYYVEFRIWIFYILLIVILSYFAFVSDIKIMQFIGFIIWASGFLILKGFRSEEHTSELQSLMRISYAVFCLKKKKHQI